MTNIGTVGILSPGDMGSGVGSVLQQHGLRVLTSLGGRGSGSRQRAAEAGIEDVGDLERLVEACDVVLSIVPPAVAGAVADQVATAVRATSADLVYADCNAIAPGTARGVFQTIVDAGARFADAGIIGGPPNRSNCRIFTSGPGAQELLELRNFGLDIRVLEGEVGQASGLKMCYAAMTKGLQALGAELLSAAKLLGVEDALRAEQTQGGDLATVRRFVERALPSMPPKAYRWIGEMEEISRCFEELGIPGRLMLGAADVYTNFRDGGVLATTLPLARDVTPA
ncbi:MAG: NAD(P)-dependent oxidoreductase [Acetobacteraceae bacterium]|nr:NAD(P)-dependent oxidoreductase [Acetobacteraceae bacterium]